MPSIPLFEIPQILLSYPNMSKTAQSKLTEFFQSLRSDNDLRDEDAPPEIEEPEPVVLKPEKRVFKPANTEAREARVRAYQEYYANDPKIYGDTADIDAELEEMQEELKVAAATTVEPPKKEVNLSLHVATVLNDLDQVKQLVVKGADLSIKDKQGKTALDIAVDFGHTEIEKLLRAVA